MTGEQLRVTEGKERGRLLSVPAQLLLGRGAGEEGRLGGDPRISRRHARISRGTDGRLSIEDLGSANGTLVNDHRIDALRVLEVGDVITLGSTVLEVVADPAEMAVPARPAVDAPASQPAGVATEPGEVLVVTGGSASGRRLAVAPELEIGRGVSGAGKLSDDLELSRRHARVRRDASGQLTIEDLGSANGTFLNGQRVHGREALKVGDSVRVGSSVLKVIDAGRAAAPSLPEVPPAAPVGVEAPPRPAPPREAPPRPAPPPPAPVRAPATPPPVAPVVELGPLAAELPMDAVFAGCRVEQVIGRGDMGVVYRAEELALQRVVALKLIVSDYASDQRFRDRFRRESRIAAAIDHPNVIPVFDAGDEGGVLYIMMRLVEGTDLRELIAADGHLDPLRAARIVRQVGAALDAAHARGMLHRDVKPSNVLLARRDHAYLSDFGLAKPADSVEALTRAGTIVARAEYVAPEQVLGQRVDARADIYALGCLLFEALTGEPPFQRWPGGPAGLAHVDAPPPSPLELRPDLPRGFDPVVRRAMAKDPNERYPSAGDLGQAALVAAGGLRQATAWSVVATGEAAPMRSGQARPAVKARATPAAAPMPVGVPAAEAQSATKGAQAEGSEALRWAVALAGLVIVAVGMLAALHGISTL